MDAEADQADGRERQEAERGAHRHPQAIARPGGGKHEERQHQPRRDLDAHAGDQRAGGGAKARVRARGKQEGEREQ